MTQTDFDSSVQSELVLHWAQPTSGLHTWPFAHPLHAEAPLPVLALAEFVELDEGAPPAPPEPVLDDAEVEVGGFVVSFEVHPANAKSDSPTPTKVPNR